MHVFAGQFRKIMAILHPLLYKTIIFIAHHLSIAKACDKIIVLEDGEMIGYGTHKNLMESCEVYREISQSQMGGGIDEA